MRLATSAGEMMRQVEAANLKKKVPQMYPGDTVRLQVRVLEGGKERLQVYEGLVVGIKGGGSRRMVTVRKMSFGIGVERIFPVHSPFLGKIEIVKKGRVRRGKLYYLRSLSGKGARLKQEYLEGAETSIAEEAAPEMVPGGQEEAAVEAAVKAPAKAPAKEPEKAAAKSAKAKEKKPAKS